MRYDVECPYCGEGQEICHDDGFGYEEGKAHQDHCYDCGKNFVFYTSISFNYEAEKADCLNGADHKYRPVHNPGYPKHVYCEDCGHDSRGNYSKEAEDKYWADFEARRAGA